METNIKGIIFDLGNVLIDFDHTIAAKRVCEFTDKTAEEIYELFFDSELTCLFEEGKVSPSEFFLKLKEMLNLKLDYKCFVPIWNEIFFFTEKNNAVYNTAKSLKNYYKIMLLSNINVLHFDYLRMHFPVFDAFGHIITSYEAGFRKPKPQIYKTALETLGLSPYEVIYTDDRLELIEKARELGIKSFHFQGIEKLKEDFLASGININKEILKESSEKV